MSVSTKLVTCTVSVCIHLIVSLQSRSGESCLWSTGNSDSFRVSSREKTRFSLVGNFSRSMDVVASDRGDDETIVNRDEIIYISVAFERKYRKIQCFHW